MSDVEAHVFTHDSYNGMKYPFRVTIAKTLRQESIAGRPVMKGDVYLVTGYDMEANCFLAVNYGLMVLLPVAWVESIEEDIPEDVIDIDDIDRVSDHYKNHPLYGRF